MGKYEINNINNNDNIKYPEVVDARMKIKFRDIKIMEPFIFLHHDLGVCLKTFSRYYIYNRNGATYESYVKNISSEVIKSKEPFEFKALRKASEAHQYGK